MSRDEYRQPFEQTNGKTVFLHPRDISAIYALSTQKHGPCLLIKIRQGDDVWIRDTQEARNGLDIASSPPLKRDDAGDHS